MPSNLASIRQGVLAHQRRVDAQDAMDRRHNLLNNEAIRLNQLAAELDARSAALRKAERDLQARAAALSQSLSKEIVAENIATGGRLLLADTARPSNNGNGRHLAEARTVADQIAFLGRVRRGEASLDADPRQLSPAAAMILRAGRIRRGEEAEEQTTNNKKPVTEHERTAAMILRAGRIRRGEEVEQ